MKTILVAGAVSLVLALFGTPLAIRIFTKRGYGQAIREEGPAGHARPGGPPAHLLVDGTGPAAQLVHGAEHRERPPAPRHDGQRVDRRGHGLRAGVIGVVDHGHPVRPLRDLHPPPAPGDGG